MAERIDVVSEETGMTLDTYLFQAGSNIEAWIAEYVAAMPADRFLRRRDARPPTQRARLTWSSVHRLRHMHAHDDVPVMVLATMFGVSPAAVSAILSNATWAVKCYYPVPNQSDVLP